MGSARRVMPEEEDDDTAEAVEEPRAPEADHAVEGPDGTLWWFTESAPKAAWYRDGVAMMQDEVPDEVRTAWRERRDDPVEEEIARVGAMYSAAGVQPDAPTRAPDPADIDALLRMASEHGALTGKVATLAGQVRSLRASVRLVLKATDRYSDSRRAPWWLEAHNALRRSDDA